MDFIYSKTTTAKNGSLIPLFKNEKPMNSRYNPEREAVTFVHTIVNSDFFVVIGAGASFHILSLHEKFSESIIIAVEFYKKDLNFIKDYFPLLKELEKSEKVFFTDFENLNNLMLEKYNPHFYSSFAILKHPAWCKENPCETEKIINNLHKISDITASDYATQAHFGKIWQHNIFLNLPAIQPVKFVPDTSKKAAVIAAGPSLDQSIKKIIKNQDSYFIISTDTAYKTLLKRNILCDAVVSIDGQQFSTGHFTDKPDSRTVFIFDICGNHDAVKKIENSGNRIIFSSSGHPLINLIENITGFPLTIKLNPGAGTVTSSAIDFAIKSGFSEIEVFGADFSYYGKKPYAKGTYLDSNYYNNQNRISNGFSKFINLMFRSELIDENSIKTTKLLSSYKENLLFWLNQEKLPFKYEDLILKITNKNKGINYECKKMNLFEIKNQLLQVYSNIDFKKGLYNIETFALLPFTAWLKSNNSNSQNSFDLLDFLKLAVSDVVRYTELL